MNISSCLYQYYCSSSNFTIRCSFTFLTEINSRYYGLSLMRTLTRGPYSVHFKGSWLFFGGIGTYVTVNLRHKAYDQGFNKEIRYFYFIPIPIQLLVNRGRGNAIMKWRCILANNLFHFFQAFDLKRHPLGRLVNRLVDVFRASYVGMGTHRRLLPHAVAETKSFVIRVYSIVRYDLPLENSRHFATPLVSREMTSEQASANSILMTCQYPDVGGAFDWLKQISLAARQIRSTT